MSGLAQSSFVRPARSDDAEGISRVIVAALRGSNSRDYPEAVIARVEQSFSPTAVSDLLGRRLVFVAVVGNLVVGTAGLDGRVVRSVFVDPKFQGRGFGRALMREVERAAIKSGVALLSVPSSVTAEPFYARLGFTPSRDSFHGEERTIIMERQLSTVTPG